MPRIRRRARWRAGSSHGACPTGWRLEGDGFTVEGAAIVERRGGRSEAIVPVSSVRVLGRHILSDIVAATAIARSAGGSVAAIAEAVAAFGGLPHAMELVATLDGVRFVNDSKATNIESARRSIESVDRDLVVVMGGRFKGGDFRDLIAPLAARQAVVVAIGEASARIVERWAARSAWRRPAAWPTRCGWRTRWRRRRARWCSRRRVRASTCSATTRSAVTVFTAEVRRLVEQRRATREQ